MELAFAYAHVADAQLRLERYQKFSSYPRTSREYAAYARAHFDLQHSRLALDRALDQSRMKSEDTTVALTARSPFSALPYQNATSRALTKRKHSKP
ncbi:hypothetical protein RBI22_24240 [Alcaligenaceae bacterium C4P045]|nr:hypothetical protein [Alcaligenaceae bacterium C4P045]